MIRINLLPIKEFKRRQAIKMQSVSFLISLAVLIVLLGLAYFSQTGKVDGLLDGKAAIKMQYEAAQAKLEILKDQKAKMEILNKRISLIIELINQRSGPVKLLDEIINRTPSGEIWLTSLNQQSETIQITLAPEPVAAPKKKTIQEMREAFASKSKKDMIKEKITTTIQKKKAEAAAEPTKQNIIVEMLTLKGIAKNNQTLARYIDALEKSPILKDVKLISSVQFIVNTRRLKRFHLKTQVDYLAMEEKLAETEKGSGS